MKKWTFASVNGINKKVNICAVNRINQKVIFVSGTGTIKK